MDEPANNPQAAKQLVLALVVVLGGVSLGSWLVLRKERPGRSQRPLATATATSPRGAVVQGMVAVPGGKFRMGSAEGRSDERPVREVELAGFWMDRTEVTNEAFDAFVKATGYVLLAERESRGAGTPVGSGGVGWRGVPAGKEKHPVVGISWEDAMAYANWAGKRLPTEAEWEYAARGGLAGRRYPWGDDEPRAGAVVAKGGGVEGAAAAGEGGTRPVGSSPANGFGLHDMSGNAWEWCSDWYVPGYEGGTTRNPTGPASGWDPPGPEGAGRVIRGGSFRSAAGPDSDLRCAARGRAEPSTGSPEVGFRCVRDGPLNSR